jgi:hypothetical protein
MDEPPAAAPGADQAPAAVSKAGDRSGQEVVAHEVAGQEVEEQDMAALLAIYARVGGVPQPQTQPPALVQVQASVAAAQARQVQARQAALAAWR